MSRKSIANQFLNYTKKTEKDERLIKKCKCGNEVHPYLLIINPVTNEIEEAMQLKTMKRTKLKTSKSKSKSKSKSNSKHSTLKRGGKKHKKTIKKKGKGRKHKTRKHK